MNWILGKAKYDLPLVLFPGLLILPLIPFMNDRESITFLIVGFLGLAVADAGHVYTTAWRLATEKSIYSKLITYAIPVAVFVTIFLWYYFKIPLLWSAVVYATFFHHIRQFYGVSRWYQRLNKNLRKTSDFFLYTLTIMPLVMLHFTTGIEFTYYTDQDILFYPSNTILYPLLAVYILLVIAWLAWEAFLYFKKNQKELNRFFSVLGPAALYLLAMIGAKDYREAVFIPLLLGHGIPYIAIISWRLDKKQKLKAKKFSIIFGLVLVSAVALGTAEMVVQEGFLDISYQYLNNAPSTFWAAIIALYLTPLISHYLWDMYIWTRDYMK